MCGLTARVMECAAGGRPCSGCEPSFAGAGIAGASGPPPHTSLGAHVGGPILAEGFSS